MRCIVLWRTSRMTPEGRVRSGNSAKRSSAGVLLPIVFTLGNHVEAIWADVDREVTLSRILLYAAVDKRLKLASRSTLMIGSWTLATTNRQVKSCRRPRLNVRVCHPYFGMGIPLVVKKS